VKRPGTHAARSAAPDGNQVAGVALTNPDRVLYPEIGLTKVDLARYYEAVAETMLPHIANRPLMLRRCPKGHTGQCFYQKHMNASTPKQVRSIPIREDSEERLYLIVNDVAGLISLAQSAALEIHTWGSRAENLEAPDQMIFDLDPGPNVEWSAVIEAAARIRALLQQVGLECFAKLSGGKGLHLVSPLEPEDPWDNVAAFSSAVADALATVQPERYIATMSKAKRRGKIFIDYLRNQRGATCAAVFSPRSRVRAPVSVPIAWSDLASKSDPTAYSVQNYPDWLARAKKAWADFEAARRPLPRHLLGPRSRRRGSARRTG
jgi:bifunctional non-homologous end joining protein LigD